MLSRSLLIFIFLGLILFSFTFAPVLACDPDTGDTLACSSTAIHPSSNTVMATVPNMPDGAATNLANVPVAIPLSCLLPIDAIQSNALGVPDICPTAPVRVSVFKAAPTPVPAPKVAVAAAAPAPKGDSPNSAKSLSDAWQTLERDGIHWYKIDNGQNFYLDVWLDANGQSGITFSMFSPEQTNALSIDTIPKGRGGYVKNEPHDLLWKGSYATGVWYVLVRNYNSIPVQYKLGSQQSTTDRICVGFWENLHGAPVWWVDCGHYGIGGAK